MGGTNTRLPQQWVVSAGVVPTARRYRSDILPLGAGTAGCGRNGAAAESPTVTFAELPAPQQVSRKAAERSATLHIGEASLDIYPGCDAEQLKTLVELLRLC